jgi:hypothetical protein
MTFTEVIGGGGKVKVYKRRVLRKIFGPNWEEVIGG